MRKDFEIIANWIESNSNIIDLGCGDGELIRYIQKQKNIIATGVENNYSKLEKCILTKMSIFHQDIAKAFEYYSEQKFDFVILSQTIQVIAEPDFFIQKSLEIGKKIIISFANYGYFINRLQFLIGKKPINYAFNQSWYNNTDIHPVTIIDFENYCKKKKIKIIEKVFLKGNWQKKSKLFPNLLAGSAIYLLEKN